MITLENLTLSNPGEVLAVCGLFVLATRQDRSATLAWTDSGAVIDTEQTLDVLLQLVVDSTPVLENSGTGQEPKQVALGQITLDWWINKAPRSKFWAGRVTAASLIPKLHLACKDAGVGNWRVSVACDQTYGIDPYAVWTAIDLGWSPNKQDANIAARPWVELLAIIGVQGFSPVITSRQLHYELWQTPLTLLPARLIFRGTKKQGVPINTQHWRATVLKKGKFSVIQFANKE